MATYSRIRRQQLLREAEGYLELASVLAERYPLNPANRDRIVERAIGSLDQLEPRARQGGRAMNLRGEAHRLKEEFELAIDPLRIAVERDPTRLASHLSLAACLKRVGKVDFAIQALEEALASDHEQAIVHYQLACCWSLAKNVGLTLVYLSQALELDPDYRELVNAEADFDGVRNHPEFVALTSVIV